ncbi:flagellar hook-basal body complex protein [Zhaonella formicivorans]|uniref:flagellar hook-basal body complex protein n=1 Tax=Zhaonella formicivorans TaxID=2528593 RepID=UPI0010D5AF77|nr:flagellar hook-basal body complex protein [Zhaonella formicivorans]
MMRSMYAAVAGLRTHQIRMDVIGDNIANVNTPGFKRARATFQDMFYQTLQGGSAADATTGGTNPKQIGLGISLGSIDVIHTQGASAPTGKGNDLMIQGEGFFVLSDTGDDTGNIYYTRAGNFIFNSEGDLVNSNGLYVLSTDGTKITVPVNAQNYSISSDGKVKYLDDNGLNESQVITIAKFSNPSGLLKVGQNLYVYDSAAGPEADGTDGTSGSPIGGPPGSAEGRGSIVAGALEMSNVELAQEFTEMIITQRGFQANAKTITTSDEMLQELVNLKR